MNCMIIDDDEMSRIALNQLISKTEDLELIETCNNAIEAMSVLYSKKIDLLLLDIEMPGISGIQLIKSIKNPPLIIAVSSHKEYEVQSLNLNIVDFLNKPVSPNQFYKTIEKVRNQLKKDNEFVANIK